MTYEGMTGNERLYLGGNLEKFDRALSQRDTKTLVEILRAVEYEDVQIRGMLEIEGFSSEDVEMFLKKPRA